MLGITRLGIDDGLHAHNCFSCCRSCQRRPSKLKDLSMHAQNSPATQLRTSRQLSQTAAPDKPASPRRRTRLGNPNQHLEFATSDRLRLLWFSSGAARHCEPAAGRRENNFCSEDTLPKRGRLAHEPGCRDSAATPVTAPAGTVWKV